MWFGFGLITLTIALVVGLATRLASRWRGVRSQHRDGEYELQETWNKGQLVRVRIGVSAPDHFHFVVREEKWQDRAFKWIGLAYEIQTSDAQFDRTLYIESDARGVAVLLKRNPALRRALMEVFAVADVSRCKRARLRCAHRRLWMEFTPKTKQDAPGAVEAMIPLLHRLRQAIVAHPLTAHDLADPFVFRAAAVLSVSTATLCLGLYGVLRATVGRTDILDPWLLLYACVPPALVVTGCVLVGIIKWLGGTSRAHMVVLEFALVGTTGFVLSAFALAREANIEFDSQRVPQHVLVTNVCAEHRITRARGTRHNYYLHTWDWRAGRTGRRKVIEIEAEDYVRLRSANAVLIDVRPGALGFPWVAGIQLHPEPERHAVIAHIRPEAFSADTLQPFDLLPSSKATTFKDR